MPGVWWNQMMARCRNLVLAKPCGQALASRSCTDVALTEAGKCNYCRPRAPDELEEFMTILIKEVDKAVAKVSPSAYVRHHTAACLTHL